MHHRLICTRQKLLALSLNGVLLLSAPSFALAADDFSSTWQPTPLVDTNAPANKPSTTSQSAKASVEPDTQRLEEVLKPAEPFIASVEARLSIKPKAGSLLTRRLNTLQTILYGEQKYQDAGELLAKLAEMFPQEAEKANAALAKQMAAPPNPAVTTASASGRKPGKVMMSRSTAKTTLEAPPMAMPMVAQPAPAPQQPPKPKKSFWSSFDDDENSLFNDPFFKANDDSSFFDSGSRIQSQSTGPAIAPQASQPLPTDSDPRSNSGSLSALGGGLMQLAMLAGSVAGSYYLDKKLGRDNKTGTYNSDGTYVDPYGRVYAPASPYGYPYPQSYGYPSYPNGSGYLPGYGYNTGAVTQSVPSGTYDAYGRRLPTYYHYSSPDTYLPYSPQSLIPSLGSFSEYYTKPN